MKNWLIIALILVIAVMSFGLIMKLFKLLLYGALIVAAGVLVVRYLLPKLLE